MRQTFVKNLSVHGNAWSCDHVAYEEFKYNIFLFQIFEGLLF